MKFCTLSWSAVSNGVVVPILVIVMLMGSREAVMGQFTLKPLLARVLEIFDPWLRAMSDDY